MSIAHLPVEVLDILLWLMNVDEAHSLRLANRELAATVSATSTFKSYFYNKTIDVGNRGQLESLVKLTQPGQLGCLLEHLSLTSKHTPLPDEVGVEYLSQSLENLRKHSKHTCLKKLTLRAGNSSIDAAEETKDWRPAWSQAGQVFSVAMDALAASGTAVESLDIFGDSERCSLACDLVAEKLPILKSTNPFRLLTSLTVSTSHHVAEHPESAASRSALYDTQNAQAVSSFIQMAPSLTDLHLHWYNLYTSALSER